MFYRPEDGHGLPHNPFNAIVTPRPIGWISSRSVDGIDNIAPYSFFNGVAYVPPQVMFSTTTGKADQEIGKDSLVNVRDTGVFCVNIVAAAARDAMNATAEHLPKEVDEFSHAGIERAECETIACPRVDDAPAAMECKLTQIVQLPGDGNFVVFGEVTGIHLRDDCIVDGKFDATVYHPLSRMGYRDYTIVREVFELVRPDE